ncbi:unnamed protein product [Rhizophagus irregularis]|nr:unnamed protein product [Rhizophagus irregularis]
MLNQIKLLSLLFRPFLSTAVSEFWTSLAKGKLVFCLCYKQLVFCLSTAVSELDLRSPSSNLSKTIHILLIGLAGHFCFSGERSLVMTMAAPAIAPMTLPSVRTIIAPKGTPMVS